jgi:hypothetical protein
MTATSVGCHRCSSLRVLALGALLLVRGRAPAQTDPLPSENGGSATQASHACIRPTTDTASPTFVPPAERIATRAGS